MFAVKGWNVSSAALKTQTAPVPEISVPSATAAADGASKKRKRGKDKAAPTAQVNEANVEALWQKEIEGKKDDKKAKKDKERKKQKLEEQEAAEAAETGSAAPAAAPAAETGSAAPAPAPAASGQDQDFTMDADAKKVMERMIGASMQMDKKNQNPNQNKKDAKKDGKKDNNKKPKKTKEQKEEEQQKRALVKSAAATIAASAPPAMPPASKLTPMQAAMRQKLVSARFRHLNETLYTAPSTTSLELFSQNPDMFDDYHSGFRQQVTTWPENPVESFIRVLRERGSIKAPKSQKQMFRDKKRGKEQQPDGTVAKPGLAPLPRTNGTCIIADLGCGDARMAEILTESGDFRKHNLKILSYDLQSTKPLVTKADIANLPVKDGSVDVAIFCLALMGTNWIDFIEEAWRILHWKGELWIAEIKSRFGRVGGDRGVKGGQPGKPVEHSVGSKKKLAAMKKKDDEERKRRNEVDDDEALKTEVDENPSSREETDVGGFIDVLARRGFVLKDDAAVDLSNKMFVRLEFVKAANPVVGKNVKQDDAADKSKAAGAAGETWQRKPRKMFIEKEVKEVSVEDEAKVLKPCLYKIR